MKTAKQQVIDFVEKHYQKEKEKCDTGFGTNHFEEWELIRDKLFYENDNSNLISEIHHLENIIKHFENDTGISRSRYEK